MAWLRCRLLSVTTTDLGGSLSSTQQLLHRHQVRPGWFGTDGGNGAVFIKNRFFQALVQEVRSRRPLVQAVQEAGHGLVRRPRGGVSSRTLKRR